MDVAAKNLDNNDRYSYEGLSEDMHTWFFLYDEKIAAKHEAETQKQVKSNLKTSFVFAIIKCSGQQEGSLFQHFCTQSGN